MDMRKWTRAQLVDCLKVRDFPSSELNKAQLLNLALKVQELNVPLIEEDDAEDCDQRFRTFENHVFDLPNKWSDDLSGMPSIEVADVLLYSCSASGPWPG